MSVPRTLLITGVGSGLGAAFAAAAVAAGHRVAGTVRTADDAGRFVQRSGGQAIAVVLDLASEAGVADAVAGVEAALGPIDVLVNNAGFGHEGAVEESSLEALHRQFAVNVFAPVALIKAVLPGMRERRHGHIVNVTSMAGSVGLPGIAYYCGSKFAMEGISEALAKEVKPFGIHVTALAPGQFRTDWAGRSMERSARQIADYDPIIDPLRQARLAKSGQQPGDPSKAAQVLLDLLDRPNPPARMFLGADALALAGQKVKRLAAEITACEDVARATASD